MLVLEIQKSAQWDIRQSEMYNRAKYLEMKQTVVVSF